eukprot:1879896-Amphidinium_carterae.1
MALGTSSILGCIKERSRLLHRHTRSAIIEHPSSRAAIGNRSLSQLYKARATPLRPLSCLASHVSLYVQTTAHEKRLAFKMELLASRNELPSCHYPKVGRHKAA